MGNKCIVFVRVSTIKQDFDNQERELYEMAIADGYAEDDIFLIAEKESGRKLTEEERAGLNRMKELIETDSSINCVYAWEVSRIARRKKINFSILDYLQVRNIQLIIKTPFIKLFNDDGTVNEGAEIVFTLFSQMAESEVRNREARFARTKKDYATTMRYSGGRVKFGYEIIDGTYSINEYQSGIIRLVYDLYINQNYGYSKTWRELQERGYNISYNQIINILRETAYIGKNQKGKTTYDRNYPIIINEDLFKQVQKIKEIKNKTVVKTKVYWFGNKLIKCPECGGFYYANKGSKIYQCYFHSLHNKDKERCPNKESININVLDTILWHIAKHEESRYLGKQATEDRAKYIKQIEILNLKIDNAEKQLIKEEKNIEKVADNYVSGLYNREKRDEKITEVRVSINSINKKSVEWKNEINHINELVSIINKKINIETPISFNNDNEELTKFDKTVKEQIYNANQEVQQAVQMIKVVNEITDVKEMYNIVHRHIANVEIEDSKCNGREAKKVRIIPYNGIVRTFYSISKIGKQSPTAKPKPRIFMELSDGSGGIEIRPLDIEILQRIFTEKRL